MLSISAMGAGQGNYYLNLAREDYYLAGGEPPGQWLGQGAEALGLAAGKVLRAELENLLNGIPAAGGRPLIQVQRYQDGRKRQPGWDLTFSAPKSVSVLWSQASAETRRAIEEAHARSVVRAFRYLEEVAAFSRRGKHGRELSRASLVAAVFDHGTSRAQDPQLHSHLLVMNVGRRSDGTFGTVRSRDFYQHQMAAGALYRSELARHLRQDLGLALRQVDRWFEIESIPQKLIDAFSKRRAQILEAMDEHGLFGPRAAEMFALSTREVKGHAAREDLFRVWREAGRGLGFDPETALERTPETINPAAALSMLAATAVADVARSQSHFTERDVLRRALERTQHLGYGADAVIAVVRDHLKDPVHVVGLGRSQGYEHFSTLENMDAEKRLREIADRSIEKKAHPVTDGNLRRVVERFSTLNPEQKRALRYVTQRTGGIRCVSGMAGTGKTHLLKAAREAWEAEGYKVIGGCLAAVAALGLQEAAGIPSRTIAKYLIEWKRESEKTMLGDIRKAILQAIKYDRSAVGAWLSDRRKAAAWALDSKTVLVIDEAGMVDTRAMDVILRKAESAGAKVVLVGDERQIQPVEAGGPFAALVNWLGAVRLKEVVRQRQEWMRDAVHQFAAGDAEAGLAHYAKRGYLDLADTKAEALTSLVRTWDEKRTTELRRSLIIAGTNAEVFELNRRAQARRVSLGELSDRKSVFVGAERLLVGDRVVFTENRYDLGVFNGDFGTIERIDREHLLGERRLSVRLDRSDVLKGRLGTGESVSVRVTIGMTDFKEIRLGYAVTAHKAQGATVERAFVLAGGWMQDREISYVQMSRSVAETYVAASRGLTGEKVAELAAEMSRSRQKELAHEFALQTLEQEMEIRR